MTCTPCSTTQQLSSTSLHRFPMQLRALGGPRDCGPPGRPHLIALASLDSSAVTLAPRAGPGGCASLLAARTRDGQLIDGLSS